MNARCRKYPRVRKKPKSNRGWLKPDNKRKNYTNLVLSPKQICGRAASSNRNSRFLSTTRESYDDGWTRGDENPLRAERIMNRVRDVRNGAENDVKFGRRFKGTGQIADLIGQRFRRACREHGLNRSPHAFNTQAFSPPIEPSSQLQLF